MRLSALSLLVAIALTMCAPGAISANKALTSTDMVNLLRSAKAVNPKSALHVAIGDKEVIVLTGRESKMSDNDCKIDATFVAKTLIDAAPDQIARVKVLFSHENDDKCDQVVVGAGDVKSYGSGQITEDQLLHSLELTSVDGKGGGVASTPASVVAGPLQERRLLLLNRIQALKEKGTGVRPFENLFQKVEEVARTGIAKDVEASVDDLSEKLKAQEQLRKQASVKPVKPDGSPSATAEPSGPVPPWMRRNGQVLGGRQQSGFKSGLSGNGLQGFKPGQNSQVNPGQAGNGSQGLSQGFAPAQDAMAIMMKIRQRYASLSPNQQAEFQAIEQLKHSRQFPEAEKRIRDFGQRLGL